MRRRPSSGRRRRQALNPSNIDRIRVTENKNSATRMSARDIRIGSEVRGIWS
jgi:hypothetical protein